MFSLHKPEHTDRIRNMVTDNNEVIIEQRVDEKAAGKKLSSFLRRDMGISGACIRRSKSMDMIFVNDIPVHTNYILSAGENVKISVSDKETPSQINPVNLDLDIIYEDEYMIAVDKQSGILCHPIMNVDRDSVANGLKYLHPDMGIHPVSRLDRETTGIVLFAKNSIVHHKMTKTDKKKVYIGMVLGTPSPLEGTIDLPISRAPDTIMLRRCDPEGQPSVTHYKTLRSYGGASVVQFILETGRTHQIRVHCKEKGFPIIHDGLYGTASAYDAFIDRQALHSYSMSFIHPFTKEPIELTASIHKDMMDLEESIKNLQE